MKKNVKKILKILALLCGCTMLFAAFASCTPAVDHSTGTQTEGDGSGNIDTPIDEADKAKYSYRPQITTEMPVIRINTADGSNKFATQYNRDSKLNGAIQYVDGSVSVENCEKSYALGNVAAQVKVRGNYTLNYEKKPLRIKFAKKQNMLGLNDGQKFKNWVLLADWKDLSMLNNTTAFYLGQTILGSDGYYASDYRNVEVYLNGEYWGVYLLAEQQEVKEGRTSTTAVADNYTGTDIGYFMEFDSYYYEERNMPGGGDPTFEMDYSDGWYNQRGYTLKSDIYSDAQIEFIRNYMNNVYRIASSATRGTYYKFNDTYTGIVAANGTYANAKEAVSAVIDVQSLVDTYILNEIACDPDIAWSSFYMDVDMSKTGSKKLVFEAPWDYDSAFGIKGSRSTGMYAYGKGNPWMDLLYNQDWFQDMVKEKWNKLYRYGVFDTALKLVNEQKNTYRAYYEKNYNRWKNRVEYGEGEVIWELNQYKDPATAQGYAADFLYNWLSERIKYLNSQFNTEPIKVDENIPAGSVAYKFEAENGLFEGGSGIGIRENASFASGNRYLGGLSGSAGKTISYTVTAEKAVKAYFFVSLSKRARRGTFSDWFTVTVNGKEVTVPTRYIEACENGEEEWHTFVSVKIAPVELKAGQNTVVFITGNDCTNFDYFELYSTVKLS